MNRALPALFVLAALGLGVACWLALRGDPEEFVRDGGGAEFESPRDEPRRASGPPSAAEEAVGEDRTDVPEVPPSEEIRVGPTEIEVRPRSAPTLVVRGLVRSEEGPVADARVWLHLGTGGPWIRAEVPPLLGRARTDAEGRFAVELDARRAGARVDLQATARDWGRALLQDVVLAAPESYHELVLERGESLRGRVVDPAGAPVAGLELLAVLNGFIADHASLAARLEQIDTVGAAWRELPFRQGRARTDAEGRFEIRGLRDGAYELLPAELPWRLPDAPVLSTGEDEYEVVAERAAALVLEIIDGGTGRPALGASGLVGLLVEGEGGELADLGSLPVRAYRGRAELVYPGGRLESLVGAGRAARFRFRGSVSASGCRETEFETPWRAGDSGVLRDEVLLDPLEEGVVDRSRRFLGRLHPVLLEVRHEDGGICREAVLVELLRTGKQYDSGPRPVFRFAPDGRGFHAGELPEGGGLAVVRAASAPPGSPGWRGTLDAGAETKEAIPVTLPRGGRLVVEGALDGPLRLRRLEATGGETSLGSYRLREGRLVISALEAGRYALEAGPPGTPRRRIVEVAAGTTVECPAP